jgi:hypothetical protein
MHTSHSSLDQIPVVRAENNQREFATLEILLEGQILIARNHQVEALGLGYGKQITILQCVPGHLPGCSDVMPKQRSTEFARDIVVEQDSHTLMNEFCFDASINTSRIRDSASSKLSEISSIGEPPT